MLKFLGAFCYKLAQSNLRTNPQKITKNFPILFAFARNSETLQRSTSSSKYLIISLTFHGFLCEYFLCTNFQIL